MTTTKLKPATIFKKVFAVPIFAWNRFSHKFDSTVV